MCWGRLGKGQRLRTAEEEYPASQTRRLGREAAWGLSSSLEAARLGGEGWGQWSGELRGGGP